MGVKRIPCIGKDVLAVGGPGVTGIGDPGANRVLARKLVLLRIELGIGPGIVDHRLRMRRRRIGQRPAPSQRRHRLERRKLAFEQRQIDPEIAHRIGDVALYRGAGRGIEDQRIELTLRIEPRAVGIFQHHLLEGRRGAAARHAVLSVVLCRLVLHGKNGETETCPQSRTISS